MLGREPERPARGQWIPHTAPRDWSLLLITRHVPRYVSQELKAREGRPVSDSPVRAEEGRGASSQLAVMCSPSQAPELQRHPLRSCLEVPPLPARPRARGRVPPAGQTSSLRKTAWRQDCIVTFVGPFAPTGLFLREKVFEIIFSNCIGIKRSITRRSTSCNLQVRYFVPSDFKRNRNSVAGP